MFLASHIIKGQFYGGIIGKWSFSYNSFVKFRDKKKHGATIWPCCIHIRVIIRCYNGNALYKLCCVKTCV